nr:unnamed protein product [Digitaria exilis]
MPKTFLNVFALPTFPHERNFMGYETVDFCPIKEELRIEPAMPSFGLFASGPVPSIVFFVPQRGPAAEFF